MNFDYYQPTKIVFGNGKISTIGEETCALGKRVLVATVPLFPAIEGGFQKIKTACEKAGVEVFHFDGVVPNPTVSCVEKGSQLARDKQIDVVIGYGGGSSMDTAKAIAVGATHPGSPWDYLFFKNEPTTATLPIISVTTTSGTGSQVTQVAVMTETKTHAKSAIYHENVYPKVAIVDPDLMETIPQHITASTGFDAFAHAFEAYIHAGTNPYIETLALKAITLVSENLSVAVNGSDTAKKSEARRNLALADTFAGLCIAGAGVTLPHGIGMMISGFCPHIMHGESLALTYPDFMRFTAPAAKEKFGKVAKILDSALVQLTDEEAADKAGEVMDRFLKEIGMWLNFKDMNVSMETLREIADHSHDLPDYENNPMIAQIDDIYRMLVNAFERV